MASKSLILPLALLAGLVAFLYGPIRQRALVVGLLRPKILPNIHGLAGSLRLIPGTEHCEDLHHHVPSNLIFAACQNEADSRASWFPPLVNFADPSVLDEPRKASINVIDPERFTTKALKLDGFEGPFVTHGMELYSDPEDPSSVYIFAVNHLPNPDHYNAKAGEAATPEKARSQVELFKHKLGSDSAQYLRGVRHAMIRMPNDIYATGPAAFYVTNDHYYREGVMREFEDLLEQNTAAWSDIVHVSVLDPKSKDPSKGLKVARSLQELHNNNGMGHAGHDRPEDVMVCDASGGVLSRLRRDVANAADTDLKLVEQVQLDSCIDNPTYFDDPYATAANNASGFVLGGLARGADMAKDWKDSSKPLPVMVWHLRTDGGDSYKSWKKDLIFQDDGKQVRSAATAALIGIDPKANAGKKQAWLFVSGFVSEGVAAAKIDL